MSFSRRFTFFDKVQLDIEKNERAFQELPVTCVSSGGGFLWIGDADGFMHCLDSTFSFASFRAHNRGPVRLCRQVPGAESRLLVTIGLSSDETGKVGEERLCVWNINKWSLQSKSSSPMCYRSIKTVIPGSGGDFGEVLALEVSSTLDVVVLGHVGGTVQLIKGDITSDRHAKRIILYDFKSPVTSLHYLPACTSQPLNKKSQVGEFLRGTTGRGSDSGLAEILDNGSVSPGQNIYSSSSTNAYLYAASESKLVGIKLGKKDELIQSTVLDSFGCQPNCSCIVTNPEKPNQKGIAMAHKEAVYFYDTDGRGPCLAIEGTKRAICVYKNYIVSIRHNKPGACMPSFPDPQSSVSLFEYRNKFFGGDFVIPWAHSIITGLGGLFILCVEDSSKVKLVELIEKDTQFMLDILFARKCFNLAVGIAESGKYSEEELAHIHRRYADHLFNQKQYDLAVKEYIQTIGTVEASYVVLRFLESGLINHLTHYLEALHKPENISRGSLTKDHTALLLNSYARLDDKERIDEFLEKLAGRSNVGKEFYDCINVLRRAGYPHQALRLAQITGNRDDCITILTEDLKDAPAALREIQSLPFEQALEAVCSHGAFLMQNAPLETAELLDGLCSNSGGRINAQHFIKIFVKNRVGLMKFLERSIEKSTSKDASLANMVETLLELMLHEASSIAKDPFSQNGEAEISHLHALIMRLLEDPNSTYDEGKALVLCKQRDFIPGCLYIWMKNKQYDQIMEHYVLSNDFEAIMRACEEYGDEVPSLWFEAFKYVSDKPQLGDKLPRILSEVESRNLAFPLAIIQFLTSPDKDKCHSLGNVRAYLLRYLESGKERVEANEAKMQRLREETLKNREIARQSKIRVKIFQQQKCAVCNQPLEPPSVHFLCDHSYHKSCYDTYSSDDHLCPECAPLIRRSLMEVNKGTIESSSIDSVKLLDELEHTLGLENVDLSTAIGTAIAQGATAESRLTLTATFPPPAVAPNNPFNDLPPKKVSNLVDSGLGGSLSSGFGQPVNRSIPSTVSSSIGKPYQPSKNPFGDDNDEEMAEKGMEETEAYPEHLNPF
nr:vacuolar protein sorting associated protein 11 [Hymenolepis microstoma]